MAEFREGVFFDLDEATYHSIPAFSASGMKHLAMSPLDYWVRSPWNPKLAEVLDEESSSEARDLGRAFHVRICEGAAAFASRYAAKLEPEDFPGVLKTADDIKAALRMLDLPVGGKKEELIARLLEARPNAKIWDVMIEKHAVEHAGKSFLTIRWLEKIMIAAAMIERNPELSKAFTGGAPEVSIFWKCPVIGVNCKARLDYLKPRAIVDLKTMAPMPGTPLQRAVAIEFARRQYFLQAAFYMEAAEQVVGFLRENKHENSLNGARQFATGTDMLAYYKALLANHPKTFLFVFQVKGVAPTAIGRTFHRESLTFKAASAKIESLKQTYRSCLEKYGTDMPWIEANPIEAFADEDVPAWSLT